MFMTNTPQSNVTGSVTSVTWRHRHGAAVMTDDYTAYSKCATHSLTHLRHFIIMITVHDILQQMINSKTKTRTKRIHTVTAIN